MTLLIILVLNAAILALITLVMSRRSKNLESTAAGAQNAKQISDQKLSQLRTELTTLKEDNIRKTKQLEEMRENSKRRLKKEATPMMQNIQETPSFDLALKTVQQQAEQPHQEELVKLKTHYEERLAKLDAQLGQRKQNIEKSKKNLNAYLMTSVENLPEDVILEMGRLIKRSEHAEKLFSATRGKLQMSQERFSEMQKRYFGVCRELALATGQALSLNEEEIRNQAEDLLIVSEKGVEVG